MGGCTLAEHASARFQEGSILGGVLGTSTSLSMGPEKGTSCAGSEKWPGFISLGVSVTFNKSPTSSTGIIVMEFLRELCHENECVDLSKKGSG